MSATRPLPRGGPSARWVVRRVIGEEMSMHSPLPYCCNMLSRVRISSRRALARPIGWVARWTIVGVLIAACGGGLRYRATPPVGCADANRRGIRLSGHVHFPGADQRPCCDRYCRPALRADLAAGVDASSRLGWADAT